VIQNLELVFPKQEERIIETGKKQHFTTWHSFGLSGQKKRRAFGPLKISGVGFNRERRAARPPFFFHTSSDFLETSQRPA
jgi:hypothetical protein